MRDAFRIGTMAWRDSDEFQDDTVASCSGWKSLKDAGGRNA